MTEPITTEQIREIQRQAQARGDHGTAWLCRDALRGIGPALRELEAQVAEQEHGGR